MEKKYRRNHDRVINEKEKLFSLPHPTETKFAHLLKSNGHVIGYNGMFLWSIPVHTEKPK
jgi:hypothetical protein